MISSWLKRASLLFGRQVIEYLTKSSYDQFEADVLRWISEHSLARAKRLQESLTRKAQMVLAEAHRLGLGERETAKRLMAAVGGTMFDALRMARTEIHTAANTGADIAARSTEIDMIKEWACTEDDRTRQSHLDANGQQVEMDEYFSVGSSQLMYPGDPNGPAEEVINCRCVALYRPRVNGEIL